MSYKNLYELMEELGFKLYKRDFYRCSITEGIYVKFYIRVGSKHLGRAHLYTKGLNKKIRDHKILRNEILKIPSFNRIR